MKQLLGIAAFLLSGIAWAQAPPPIPQPTASAIFPVPIPGGDVLIPPNLPPGNYYFWNQFSPGPTAALLDGQDAEPNGFTNFKGLVAMGYTLGTATDNAGTSYQVITDIRVYHGDYIGARSPALAFATNSAKAHGTFVEI